MGNILENVKAQSHRLALLSEGYSEDNSDILIEIFNQLKTVTEDLNKENPNRWNARLIGTMETSYYHLSNLEDPKISLTKRREAYKTVKEHTRDDLLYIYDSLKIDTKA